MAKAKEVYVCTACGYETPKWQGRCPNCGEWNSFEQQVTAAPPAAGKRAPNISHASAVQPKSITQIDVEDEVRYTTGIAELDRVLGGGIVKGSLVLLSGDPGIGKSTLLLQICGVLGEQSDILYVSGEESVRQIKLRANRLGVNSENLYMISETNVDTILSTILVHKPSLVMVDSIQTMNLEAVQSSSGSVTQVRECTNAFMHLAKSEDIPILLVGHVNKDGNIAGPKVLEHIVDAVLYFEGDRNLSYRILRAVKNRYGSTNEIAVFDMQDAGLCQVENPSAMLLSERPQGVSGTCVSSVMEGSRPIMAEVQALVTKTGFGTPRRMCTGFDYNRMSLIIAVLEKRAGYFFGTLDTYINIIGGLKLDEPAADLSIAVALISSLRDIPVEDTLIAFGELGLAGEIRSVSGVQKRVIEAQRLGFTKCILPRHSLKSLQGLESYEIEIIPVSNIRQAIAAVFHS